MDTPEAVGIRGFNVLAPSNVLPIQIIDVAVSTLFTIYDEGVTDGFLERPNVIYVHNMSIQPAHYMINGDVEIDAGVSNGEPLAGGVAANDGKGAMAIFDFRKEGISKITFISISGNLRITVQKEMVA